MLGPIKWRLLTIVAGILLAHAIESPSNGGGSSNKLNGQIKTFTNSQLGLTIEQLEPWKTSQPRVSRNLLAPNQQFSNVDNIRFIDRRSVNNKNLPQTFGAFRFTEDEYTKRQKHATDPVPNNRRSDEGPIDMIEKYDDDTEDTVELLPHPEALVQEDKKILALQSNATARKYRYKVIPIGYFANQNTDKKIEPAKTEEKTVKFPDAPKEKSTDDTARRSGISFPETVQYINNFTPQGYSEDTLNFAEIAGVQRPFATAEEYEARQFRASPEDQEQWSRNMYGNTRFLRDFSARPPITEYDSRPSETLQRPSRYVEFPGGVNVKQPFNNDVTKFGDINGPITAVQRPYVTDYSRTYEHIFGDDYRQNRQTFPNKYYADDKSKMYQPLNGYKSRSPRVVFPTGDIPSGPSGYNADNVVFR